MSHYNGSCDVLYKYLFLLASSCDTMLGVETGFHVGAAGRTATIYFGRKPIVSIGCVGHVMLGPDFSADCPAASSGRTRVTWSGNARFGSRKFISIKNGSLTNECRGVVGV